LRGGGDFKKIGKDFLGHFQAIGQLQPYESVLDVGSGVGRMAVPLTGYLAASTPYLGFDINQRGVEWCTQEIASRHPNFRFVHANIHNRFYNSTGTVAADQFVFPAADLSFDFSFATSVYTHMLTAEVLQYLKETTRCLKIGGRSLATFFLLDDEVEGLLATGKSTLKFDHSMSPECRVSELRNPELAVAFDKSFLYQAMEEMGLEITRICPGSWCGRRETVSYQDFVLVKRIR
jgi:SAM-dependent methyltransferase